MSPAECVRLSIADGVAGLELSRPEVGNAINLDVAAALARHVDAIAHDTTVRCVVLSGAGKLFCAGGDVGAMASAPDRSAFLAELARVAHQAVLGLAGLDVPVVAAVQGAAAGAGFALALVSDVVLVSESTTFMTAYTGVGLSPDCGTTWLLPRLVGRRRATLLALLNRRISARAALDWGLVTEVHADGELMDRTTSLARALADGPAPALARTKRLLAGDLTDLARHLDLEARLVAEAAGSDEAAERINAFLARSSG